MTLRTLMVAAATALNLGVVAPVPAQPPEDALPVATGKDTVVRVCAACHGADQFAFARYTPEEWEREIAKMQSAGAEMSAEEQVAILAYLSKYLAKPPAPQTADAKAAL